MSGRRSYGPHTGLMSSRSGMLSTVVSITVSLAMLWSVSCGGGSGSPSGGSTPPVTVTPTPTPTPVGGGGNPGAASCPLGPGDLNAECEKVSPKLQNAVLAAIDMVVQQQPQIFDKTEEAGIGTGQYRVLDKEAYLNAVVSNLLAAGYCSERDPDDGTYERILIKNENGFSENFDILTQERQPAEERHLLRDLHARQLPGRPRRPACAGQRLRLAVPAADQPDVLQAAPLRAGLLHARLDGDRRTGRRLLRRRPGSPTAATSARCARPTARSGYPARPGSSARPRTPGGRVRPGPSTASTAPVRKAAARTTPRTSTTCSSTSPARTRSAPTPAVLLRRSRALRRRHLQT